MARRLARLRSRRLPRLEQQMPEPGRSFRCSLFARCAGVHVDFHAHRHFDNLRSLPSHSGPPTSWRDAHAGAERRARLEQQRKCGTSTHRWLMLRFQLSDNRHFSLGQSTAILTSFAGRYRMACNNPCLLSSRRAWRPAPAVPLLARPCICFCVSCDEVATSPVARFIVLVGGCSLFRWPCRCLTGAGRCRSGTCVLQVCGTTGCIARACHCGADAQDDRGASRENQSLAYSSASPLSSCAPRRAHGRNRCGDHGFRVAGTMFPLSN